MKDMTVNCLIRELDQLPDKSKRIAIYSTSTKELCKIHGISSGSIDRVDLLVKFIEE